MPLQSVGSLDGSSFDADAIDIGAQTPSVCTESFVTPTCLRTFYGTIDYTVKAADKNSMGLNNFLGQVSNRSDTSLFLKAFRPEAAAAAYAVQDPGNQRRQQLPRPGERHEVEGGADMEGDLDSETMLGIAWPTDLTTFNTGGEPRSSPTGWRRRTATSHTSTG